VVQWLVDGRKNFTGPRSDMGLEVLEAMKSLEPNDNEETRHVKVAGKEIGPHTVKD
jgi:choline transport protein